MVSLKLKGKHPFISDGDKWVFKSTTHFTNVDTVEVSKQIKRCTFFN